MDENIPPEQCIFCKIVAREAPAHVVYEDATLLAFMDLFPAAEGHLLVIPKRHVINLLDSDDGDLVAIAPLTRRLAHAQRRALGPDGIAVVQLNGAAAGQTVWHYHVHLIPRRRGDSMQVHGRVQGEAARLAEIAKQIAAELQPRS